MRTAWTRRYGLSRVFSSVCLALHLRTVPTLVSTQSRSTHHASNDLSAGAGLTLMQLTTPKSTRLKSKQKFPTGTKFKFNEPVLKTGTCE